MLSLGRLLSCAIPCVLGALPALANVATYDVSHSFTFSPTGGVTALPVYGFNVFAEGLPGGLPASDSGSTTIGLAGDTLSHQVTSSGPSASATASSSVTLNPFNLGGSLSGTIESKGSTLVAPAIICCASSGSTVVIHSGKPTGNMTWMTEMKMGDGVSEAMGDPVNFQVTDLATGAVTTGSLFSVSSSLQNGGTWSWGGGIFAVDASTFNFSISMDSPFTVEQGTADLQIRNGFVTVSDGTGIFAGLFPAAGSPGDFSVPFSSTFPLDYNLGTFNNDPLDVKFTLSNEGSSCAIPEPSELLPLIAGVTAFIAVRRTQKQRGNVS